MMPEYTIYKFAFTTGVHLGAGILSSAESFFHADTLFSALYIEAMKKGRADRLYSAVKSGALRISDAFLFYHDQYFIPKPMLRISAADTGNSLEKKFYKSLKYIPIRNLKDYLSGNMKMTDEAKDLFSLSSRTVANVRGGENTLPYQVGICTFAEGAGLYIIARTEGDSEKTLLEALLDSLSVSGIGGERSSGLGKFVLQYGTEDEQLLRRLYQVSSTGMLIAAALPREDELEKAVDGASYNIIPRSGFVFSENYAQEQRKKRTLYVFDAGSCFQNSFDGDVYDVSRGGSHPVYRYAESMFLSLDGE